MAHSSTTSTPDRKDTSTMNDTDLRQYLLTTDMRSLDAFSPAAREVEEGDVVSIAYTFAGETYAALRLTVEKEVDYFSDTYTTQVDTGDAHRTVSIFYHVPEDEHPEPGVLLRSIILHDSEDPDVMYSPAGAPCPVRPDGCQTDGCQSEADEKMVDLVAELLGMIEAAASRSLGAVIEPEGPKDLSPDEFQSKAMETAVFPGQGTFWGLQYATSGLANEAGEVLGVIKKMQRDKGYAPADGVIMMVDRDILKGELGDVAWYLAVAAHEAAIPLSEVFSYVLAKLADRRERGVLGGSGDNR